MSGLARTHPTMYRKDQLRFNPSGVSGTGMTSLDAGGAHEVGEAFRPFLGLKVPLVQETVVRDVTLSTKLKV